MPLTPTVAQILTWGGVRVCGAMNRSGSLESLEVPSSEFGGKRRIRRVLVVRTLVVQRLNCATSFSGMEGIGFEGLQSSSPNSG